MSELPPPNGFTRIFRRVCAVLSFAFCLGLMGASAIEMIPHPPTTTYIFLLIFTGFIDPSVAAGLIDLIKGKTK